MLKEVKSLCFTAVLGWRGSRAHPAPESWLQAQSLNSVSKTEKCKGMPGSGTQGTWHSDSVALFCPSSPPFHYLFLMNSLAEHTSESPTWLSLPRVASSLLPPSPSHSPSLCLAFSSTRTGPGIVYMDLLREQILHPPSMQKLSGPLIDTSSSSSWTTALGIHIPGFFLIFGHRYLRCFRTSLTQKGTPHSAKNI